ncbi:MAG: efflux transporter outer membrane subunit [Alphaproteobacteria bacterium]
MRLPRLASLAPATLLALALTGCIAKVGPDHADPHLSTPETYSSSAPAPAEIGPWWRGFGDPTLSGLVEAALADNLDIAAAGARLAEARALAAVADAATSPTLDGSVTAQKSTTISGDRDNEPTPLQGAALASWVPDLFGGKARASESAAAELRRREALTAEARRQVAADVVRRYVETGRDWARLQLVEESLALRQKTLDLVEQRFAAGLAAQLDVSRARADLAATRAQRGPLYLSINSSRNALTVLLGGVEHRGTAAPPRFAGGPDVGLPADLLRARPDVVAAEANLARATADIGVAEARLYPMLTLPASLTLGLENLTSGVAIDAFVAAIAGTLDIPIFDGGARRAQVDAAEARAAEALLLYRQALLQAIADVQTALVALASAETRRDDLTAAVAAAEAAARQAETLYTQGLTGFLDVLDAQRTLLDTRQSLVIAEADIGLAAADLHSAVGGS